MNPLAYRALEGGALRVFASKGGAPRNPDWYHSVRANPEVEVEVAGRRIRARGQSGRRRGARADLAGAGERGSCLRPYQERRFLPQLVDLIWKRAIDPGKVFDLTLPLEEVAEGYRAMDERRAIKALLWP